MDLPDRLRQYLGREPQIHPEAFVHPRAFVIGDVTLAAGCSVWPMAVLRGDINRIVVGPESNIQDGVVVHLADDFGVEIGAGVTIGHLAMIHACTIGDHCLIGMQATVLDGARIGPGCLIGAQSLVTQGTVIPPGMLVLGSPARVVRPLRADESAHIRDLAGKYREVAQAHRIRLGL